MSFYTPYWFWESGIGEPVLQTLEREISSLQLEPGALDAGAMDTRVRHSDAAGLPGAHWFTGVLLNFIMQANEAAAWRREVILPEATQIASYRVGQFYDWHADNHPLRAEATERKLTAVCLLTDPSEFDGGQLELEIAAAPRLQRGSVIVFPSLLRHRVTPVTRGERRSATCWAHGPRVW